MTIVFYSEYCTLWDPMANAGLSSCFSETFMARHKEAIHAIILGKTLNKLLLASRTGDTDPESLAGLCSCNKQGSHTC